MTTPVAISAQARRRRGLALYLAIGGVTLAAVIGAIVAPQGLAGSGFSLQALGLGSEPVEASPTSPVAVLEQEAAAMSVDDRSQILAEGEDAEARNAAIPVSGEPLDFASRFRLASAPAAYDTALRCLTQAVYYEAAVEPLEGRRAVAQVVLNRMRHPAYPKSVCGVVYQGAERRTGCQFSFTCDGSLLRTPMARPWQEAREVARAALAGYVEKSVGTATHYHADYVLPKWAFNLAKIEQLGRHIFYRFSGSWGRNSAFTGHYSGLEAIPLLDMAALKERLLADGQDGAGELVPGLTVTPHVTDRHAASDVGGRIDTTKQWRLAIPDPSAASARYRNLVAEATVSPAQKPAELAAAATPAMVNP